MRPAIAETRREAGRTRQGTVIRKEIVTQAMRRAQPGLALAWLALHAQQDYLVP
jgi:hypothetical protein